MRTIRTFTTLCSSCGQTTNRKYASGHSGRCKACVTGVQRTERTYRCPDCGEMTLSQYQKDHHYHCDNCTKEADPVGYYNEVRGFNDGPDY